MRDTQEMANAHLSYLDNKGLDDSLTNSKGASIIGQEGMLASGKIIHKLGGSLDADKRASLLQPGTRITVGPNDLKSGQIEDSPASRGSVRRSVSVSGKDTGAKV